MSNYLINGPEDYFLMSQTGVREFFFKGEPNNSVWDSNISPSGKMYLSLSSELTVCGWARLYEYDPKSNIGRKVIDVENVILPQTRAMRASKFHTSISFMNDGKICMTTHCTDRSPNHPTWLPEQHYGHIWEGFAGSHIVVYDPKTGEAFNYGIPVPRESLYGSCYDSKHNALYSLGFMRGHLYRYSFDTHTVRDLGQATEWGSFRLLLGHDGNMYFATKSGYLCKIDTDSEKIVDMNYRLPFNGYSENYTFPASIGTISSGRIGPDKRLYFTVMYGPDVLALDTKTGTVENLGPYLPTPRYAENENRNGVFGIDFDEKGVLWYHVASVNDGSGHVLPSRPGSLFRWDVTRGGKPEWVGVIGTNNRLFCCMSELFIRDGIMSIVETNHGEEVAAVLTVDMKQFEPTMRNMQRVNIEELKDKMYKPGARDVDQYAKIFDDMSQIAANNPHTFDGSLDTSVRIWRALAPDDINNSAVRGIAWDEEGVLHGICGTEKEYGFQVKDGALAFIALLDGLDGNYVKWLRAEVAPQHAQPDINVPTYPGRQYRAKQSASANLSDGRTIVGTQDGFLAIVKGNDVFSLGMAGYNGPIRSLASTPDGRTAYGTAGDDSDLGMVFKFDEQGLTLKGNIKFGSSKSELASFASNVLSCCAVSKDGKKLAIASADRLGSVYLYNI